MTVATTIGTPAGATMINYRTGLCMGFAGGNMTPGANLIQWSCDGSTNQTVLRVNAGTQTLYGGLGTRTDSSGRIFFQFYCVGVKAGSKTQGTGLIDWACNGSPDQNWNGIPVGYSLPGASQCFLVENQNSAQLMTVGGGGVDGSGNPVRGAPIVQWGSRYSYSLDAVWCKVDEPNPGPIN